MVLITDAMQAMGLGGLLVPVTALLVALTLLPAFKAFSAEVKDRCVEPPRRVELTEIGSYGFFGD